MYEIQLVIQLTDGCALTHSKLQDQILVPSRFNYSSIKFYTKRFNARADMYFDDKDNRQVAIQEIKKLRTVYGLRYHYDMWKNEAIGRHLCNLREYEQMVRLHHRQQSSEDSEKNLYKQQQTPDKNESPQLNNYNSSSNRHNTQEGLNKQSPATQKKAKPSDNSKEQQTLQQINKFMGNQSLVNQLLIYQLKLASRGDGNTC